MGEYIYRRTSRVSEIEVDGKMVKAIHIIYAYKPYSTFGVKYNRRMSNVARLHASNALKALDRAGHEPTKIHFAVTEFDGSISGGIVLKFTDQVPALIGDYSGAWESASMGSMSNNAKFMIPEGS